MADNITLNAGTGGSALRTDDDGTAHWQYVKLAFGADNTQTIVSASDPLPVTVTDAAVTVDNGGTFAVQVDGAALTALQLIDDSVFADDTAFTLASSKVTVAGAIRDDALSTLTAIEGDAVPLRVSSNGALHVTGGGGGTQYAEDSAHNSGDTGTMALAVRNDDLAPLAGTDGDYTPLQVDARGALWTTGGDRSDRDMFSRQTTASAFNDIDIQFFKGDPDQLTVVTTANSATAAASAGGALFSSSTNANGSVQAVSREKTTYTAGSEVYALFTAAFTAGIASSYMRIGLFDANNGFFLGYEGTSFGLTVRNNGSDGAQITAFSEDALDGSAGSAFTRAGVAEAIDYTKLNVFRIRFGWLGSAPVFWEVMAPDGHWVTFHKILYPNLQAVPSIRSANLPLTLDITKTAAAATDITIQTDCWGAGTVAGPRAADADEFGFQTNATLNNGVSYDSGVIALSPEFSQVHTSVLASHNGTITITWYRDAAGTDTIRTLTITYTAANGYQLFSAPAFSPYVKYVFANDSGSNQTDFYFDTKFMRRPLSPQILRLDGPLSGGMVTQVNRSVITAYNGSSYANVNSTAGGNLKVSVQEVSDGLDVGAGNAGTETQRVSISTDDVNLSAIKTAVELIDNAISGTEMQVDIVSGNVTNAGTFAVQEDGAALTALQLIDDAVHTDDAAFTLGTSKGVMMMGFAGTQSVNANDAAALACDTDGALHISDGGNTITVDGTVTANLSATDNAVLDNIDTQTTPAQSHYRNVDANAEAAIKGSAGTLHWLHVMNMTAAVAYLHLYDATTASVTPGTTTPTFTFPIPTQGDTNGAGFNLPLGPNGHAFATAITLVCTTTIDGSAGDPGTNGVFVNAGYT